MDNGIGFAARWITGWMMTATVVTMMMEAGVEAAGRNGNNADSCAG